MHRELQRRLAKNAGVHYFAKRIAQNQMDDEPQTGTNMLPHVGGPITITIVRTIPLPVPTTASTTSPPYGYSNHGTSSTSSMSETTALPPNSSSSMQGVASTTSPSPTPASTVSVPSAEASSDNNTAADPVSGAPTRRNPLPPGAMIGIIIAGIFLVVGIAIFVIRKRYVQRRQKLRKGWARSKGSRLSVSGSYEPKEPSLGQDQDQRTAMLADNGSPATIRPSRGPRPLSLVEAQQQVSFALPAPPMSYGNDHAASASQTSLLNKNSKRTSKGYDSPVQYGPPSAAARAHYGSTATVLSGFISTLPDELAITAGETLRILAEYDDGWALCLNSRGEQGMVPRECLDGKFELDQEEMVISRGAGGKLKRISSLGATIGRRF